MHNFKVDIAHIKMVGKKVKIELRVLMSKRKEIQINDMEHMVAIH
jgi:hypothetical protein